MTHDIVNLNDARRRKDATAKALADEAAEEARPRTAWLSPGSLVAHCPHCRFAVAIPLADIETSDTGGALRFDAVGHSRFFHCGACGLRDIRVGPISIIPERVGP